MPPPTGRHQRATPPSFAQHCFEKLRLHHKLLSTFVTHRRSAVQQPTSATRPEQHGDADDVRERLREAH
jgi:hypothetical protein